MLIIGNWKAYVEDFEKAKFLFAASRKGFLRGGSHTIVIAPPGPFLGALAVKNKTPIEFAAQDVSITTGGAQTGEVTAATYAAAGATYAIIGHSERRALGDTDAIISEKIIHALACNLTPILCVGERERDGEGRYLNFIREQITSALSILTPKERAKIIIAYEPLWAIGKTATSAIKSDDLTEMALYIRKVLAELLMGKNAKNARILYGGSVEPENIRDLARNSQIDGFLIGHASTDERMFPALLKALS